MTADPELQNTFSLKFIASTTLEGSGGGALFKSGNFLEGLGGGGA